MHINQFTLRSQSIKCLSIQSVPKPSFYCTNRPDYCKSMKECERALGDDDMAEKLWEYKSLAIGVLKITVAHLHPRFVINIEKKTGKETGMIFSSNVDCCKTNPLIYIKFLRQAGLHSLMFGAELFRLTLSLLQELECCQTLKNFYAPYFTPD